MESQLFRMHQDFWPLFPLFANRVEFIFTLALFAVAIGLFFLSKHQKRSTVLPRFLFAVGVLISSYLVSIVVVYYVFTVYDTQKSVVEQVVKQYRLNPTTFHSLRCHDGKWQYSLDRGLPYQSFRPAKSCAKDRGLQTRFDELWQKSDVKKELRKGLAE